MGVKSGRKKGAPGGTKKKSGVGDKEARKEVKQVLTTGRKKIESKKRGAGSGGRLKKRKRLKNQERKAGKRKNKKSGLSGGEKTSQS